MKKIHKKTKSKRLLQIPIILIVCFVFCLSAFAHSGRTDANGGHWDRKAGTYHYHGAPKAGSSSGSTSSKPASTLPPVETPAPTSTPTRSLQYRDDFEYIFPPLPPREEERAVEVLNKII